jgi:hypothetical protein
LRGKFCATCSHWQRRGTDCHGDRIGHCMRGYHPLGPDDGCDDWQGINTTSAKSR